MEKRDLQKTKFRVRHRDALLALALLAVPVGFWLLFCGYPVVYGVVLGFFDYKGINGIPRWIGIGNFVTFFGSAEWVSALGRTVGLGMLCFLCTTLVGMLVALLLNGIKKGQGIFRAIWYIPSVTSAAATSQIFNILLSYDGVVNNILESFGKEAVYWQYSTEWMIFWIVIYSVWTGIGGSTLLWLAALQSIDPIVIEASKLDGCNRVQSFFRISVPQMMPMIAFMFINGFIGAMNIYESVLFISGGGPLGTTEVLAYKIMRSAFWDNDFGMAGCASFVVMVITLAFSALVYRRQIKSYKAAGV